MALSAQRTPSSGAEGYREIERRDMTKKKCPHNNPDCGTMRIALHTCPFKEEIHGNSKDKCRCCSDCTHDCHFET
ncbi:hypothetical protein LCGC14_0819820 [marine sediment metagenome]|uniref:Uncharacterized protein n=1 Tax=marine sediment metagenome TaxID=412755 RepID=A0A0F9SRT7_9ZZZZ